MLCNPARFLCQNGFYWPTWLISICWFQKNRVPFFSRTSSIAILNSKMAAIFIIITIINQVWLYKTIWKSYFFNNFKPYGASIYNDLYRTVMSVQTAYAISVVKSRALFGWSYKISIFRLLEYPRTICFIALQLSWINV